LIEGNKFIMKFIKNPLLDTEGFLFKLD